MNWHEIQKSIRKGLTIPTTSSQIHRAAFYLINTLPDKILFQPRNSPSQDLMHNYVIYIIYSYILIVLNIDVYLYTTHWLI